MPKVSVIVPVYNVEQYLPLCLESIRSQSLRDIEIVCVNDGSPDGSRAVLAKASNVDDRIVIVDKENGGLSSARNAGLEVARGEIVCFVDSDDELQSGALARIAEVFDKTGADVVTFGAVGAPDHRLSELVRGFLSPRDVTYERFEPALLCKEGSHPYVWRTACDRRFLIDSGLRFDEEILYGEDEIFQYCLYPRAGKTVLISDKLYRYRVDRPDSLMNYRTADLYHLLYDHLRIVERICRDWKAQGFIDRYYQELLEQIASFVLRDVIAFPSDGRLVLLRYMRNILEAYFTKEQLQSLLGNRLYGRMTRAVLLDGTWAWRFKRKFLIYEHACKTDPLALFRNGFRRIARLFGAGANDQSNTAELERLEREWMQEEWGRMERAAAQLERECAHHAIQ